MRRRGAWPILTVTALAAVALLPVLSVLDVPSVSAQEASAPADPWAPFRYFIGSWDGHGEGTPGLGQGVQTFEVILRETFLLVRNKAVFDPQNKNPRGETHVGWGIFSYDKARKAFVLRQFHVEGFVNQYVLESAPADSKTFVFVGEAIENIPPGFMARLTYKPLDADTFEQTFDLAPPARTSLAIARAS
jgi:hypothetical protein